MLLVRDAQMAVLRRAQVDDFRRRALSHLKQVSKQHSDAQPDEAQLMSTIDDALARCPRFHLHAESDVVKYLEIVCSHIGHASHGNGLAADQYPVAAMQILLAYGVAPDRKLGQFAAWAEQFAAARHEPQPSDAN